MAAPFPRVFGSAVNRSLFSIGVSLPTRPADMAKRHWNRINKEAMQVCLETHHKKRIPGHFAQSARAKYGYQPRSKRYMARKDKKYKSRRDLVKTGASERRMKREGKITIGGAAEGGKKAIEGKLTLAFDFTKQEEFLDSRKKFYRPGGLPFYSRTIARAGVSIAQMKKEIQAMTPSERKEFAAQYLAEVWKRYTAWQGQRRRIRLPGSGGSAAAA